jgi:hypothetical protein
MAGWFPTLYKTTNLFTPFLFTIVFLQHVGIKLSVASWAKLAKSYLLRHVFGIIIRKGNCPVR